jgi:hypothetical protein
MVVKKTIKESKKQTLITAYVLKSALQTFHRMKGSIVANEVTYGTGYIADIIIIDKSNRVIEVETKVSKNDLTKLECKKEDKHNSQLKDGITPVKYYYAFGKQPKSPFIEEDKSISEYIPDMFYFCVPTNLVKEAIKFCNEVNPKYGVIEFRENHRNIKNVLTIVRRAKPLLEDITHKDKQLAYFKDCVLKRLSNEIVTIYSNQFWQQYLKNLTNTKVN